MNNNITLSTKKRRINPGLKAFADLSAFIAKNMEIPNGRDAKLIASKVLKDAKEKHPEIAKDIVKIKEKAMEMFKKDHDEDDHDDKKSKKKSYGKKQKGGAAAPEKKPRKANPSLKAFADLSAFVAKHMGIPNGRDAKLIASKVLKAAKEKHPEIATDPAKVTEKAMEMFKKDMSFYK